MFTHCKQKSNNICIVIKYLPLKQKTFQCLNACLKLKLHFLASEQEHKPKKKLFILLKKVCFFSDNGLTFMLNRLSQGVYSKFVHFFFTEGTFSAYGSLYQNENSPENFCLVPLLIFELLRHKGFFPH